MRSSPDSSTSTKVPATGRPIGIVVTSSAGRSSMMWQVVLIVDSVGP